MHTSKPPWWWPTLRKKERESKENSFERVGWICWDGWAGGASFWNFRIGLVGGHYWWQPAGAIGEFWRGLFPGAVVPMGSSRLLRRTMYLSTCGDIGATLVIIYENEGCSNQGIHIHIFPSFNLRGDISCCKLQGMHRVSSWTTEVNNLPSQTRYTVAFSLGQGSVSLPMLILGWWQCYCHLSVMYTDKNYRDGLRLTRDIIQTRLGLNLTTINVQNCRGRPKQLHIAIALWKDSALCLLNQACIYSFTLLLCFF